MRALVTDDILGQLVGEQLGGCIATGVGFTAHEITRVLRMEHPHLDIPHAAVRAWVHRYMQAVLSTGLYTSSRRAFGDGDALVYEPSPAMSLPTLPSLPISLN